MSLEEGDKVPPFELPTDGGGRISPESLKGRPYVLYFYPKDDTPGCTKEAITFSGVYDEFRRAGVELVGVSKDSIASHDNFKAKHDLTFPLASDETTKVAEAFGSWIEKNMYGKIFMGIDRSTFLVDKNGKLVKAWRGVKVPGHVEEVLDAAKMVAED